MSVRRVQPAESVVVVVDVQERLAPAMPEAQLAALTRAATVLIEGAGLLGAGVLATEQYPKGLGPTIPRIQEKLDAAGVTVLPKMTFSACEAEGFEALWTKRGARVAIVVGMETHVCVYQTVRDLCAQGIEVLVPADGVASRREDHRQVGLDLCRSAGATITTMETVVFDWLRVAGTEPFRMLSKLIR
ncbi:isochorismatase family protein [Chondromyces apiculatus]|uniref:Isochorismatase n=1 Tax=Chondromyces apiculatus DSM 436 TaxID=1192034 RepID=A0A017T253_9BACT|nr:isochorismatase family protein [Chondromyces apiculatus]EYF02930.1 Isochorismatase [Chondromyces apiculatus DSM 436]